MAAVVRSVSAVGQRARGAAQGALRGATTSAAAPQAFAPGNFYSPVPPASLLSDPSERSRVWPDSPADPPGIDVRASAQLDLLARLSAHRWPSSVGPAPAYDPGNDQFPIQDAALLRALLLELRPARMVEVGCGWSTTVTARALADGGIDCDLTCIEPYPRDFLPSLDQIDALRIEKVEHTPLSVFTALGAGDVLFIDSSHVAKTGSDVVHLVLEVLPRLADGVVVHVHDIFWPHDYPQGWVRAGFGWNEQYLLQAYLSGNARAHVLALNHWLAVRHPDAVESAFGAVGLDGSSVWFTTGPEPTDGV
jgi:predicted O-methyltransferase YrrM